MLDNRIYSANQAIMMQRNRENFCLELANIINLLISVGILVWYILLKKYYSNLIFTISSGLEMVYLITWSYALYSLFARFSASEHLLPRKRVFIVHAALLTVFFFCQVIAIVVNKIENCGNCDANCKEIC